MSENPFAKPDSQVGTSGLSEKSSWRLSRAFTLIAIAFVCTALIVPFVRRDARPAARRTQCKNNLKQILYALHDYHDVHNAMPPAFTTDVEGRPLHSWRTLILPFLKQKQLYESIDLSKPWNHPANAAALKSVPSVYRCPGAEQSDGTTMYLAIVGENTFLHPTNPRPLSEITDGTGNTLAVIEVAQELAVPWMSPHDADETTVTSFERGGKLVHSKGYETAFTNAALVDGSVRTLSADLSLETRRALISINGNETVGEF